MLDYPTLVTIQLILIVVNAIWMLQRNDELPLLVSCFTGYISSYRYWAVASGNGEWVNITNFGFEPITNEGALSALGQIILGEICLLAAYMLQQKNRLPIIVPFSDYPFLAWLRPRVFFIGLMCLPLVVIVRGRIAAQTGAGQSLAFQVSGYLFLFPMLLIGVATLIFCLWKFGGLTSLLHRFISLLILSGVAYLTYNPTSRFQFLAWIIAGGVILSSSYRAKTRLITFAVTAVLALSLFAMAGALRTVQSGEALDQAAVQRAFSAEDANMLDGFVLMQQVYPQRLSYTYGMGHMEILMRPIPRSLWPSKPVGGYMNKLGLTIDGGGTLGISQSLFGSLYEEGGTLGVVILSMTYGTILAKIVNYSVYIQPFASIMVRAILCACLVPLLRGGDLPGIYAWFGMAFWPCFLVLWLKRHYFSWQAYLAYLNYFNKNYPVGHSPYLDHPS